MKTYKYLSDSTVAKIDGDGISRMSCAVVNPEYLAWIAEGNTPLPADPPVRSILSEISAIEHQTLMPRATREFMLVLYMAQAAGAGITEAQLLDTQHPAYSPAYAKLKALDSDIAALRALL